MLEDYVVIDLEMTGLNAKTDQILELGAVRVRGGKQTDCFSKIINPERKISDTVTRLTGITNEMAKQGAELDAAMEEFLDFIGKDVIVGQNVIFDYSFLKQWAVNHKITFEKCACDTLKIARKCLPEEQKKDLESLCTFFEIRRENAHRALDDAVETGLIFEKMKAMYAESEPGVFEPKPLLYKAKKQSPATPQQKKYLQKFAEYHGIILPEMPENLTKSEASRMTDQLILKYGKMAKPAEK